MVLTVEKASKGAMMKIPRTKVANTYFFGSINLSEKTKKIKIARVGTIAIKNSKMLLDIVVYLFSS